MIYYLKDEKYEEASLKNAGSKAREDCENLFNMRGYIPLICKVSNDINYNYQIIKNSLLLLKSGDCIILSLALYFPILKLKDLLDIIKKQNIKIIIFVHDLNVIRRGFNYFQPWVRLSIPKHEIYNEEYEILKRADYIIVHNYKMYDVIKKSFKKINILTLNCFDYLSNYIDDKKCIYEYNNSIVIAGNLSINKAKYIYLLPKTNNFYLYGVGYNDKITQSNVKYCGSFYPNELIPQISKYSFGLIWDGKSINTCNGTFGNYLKYNNPHKLSLYLAAGLPVIVWTKSAIAKFVIDNNIGICVNNLNEINDKISKINYDLLKNNAIKIGEKIRKGYFLNTCLNKLEICLNEK